MVQFAEGLLLQAHRWMIDGDVDIRNCAASMVMAALARSVPTLFSQSLSRSLTILMEGPLFAKSVRPPRAWRARGAPHGG